jgi:hypothetical protein
LREAWFVDDADAPEPVVEFSTGTRMLLSAAMADYSVEWASQEERDLFWVAGQEPIPPRREPKA